MIPKILIYVAGALTGGLGGFLLWKFVGCRTGSCPITSSPVSSTIFGIIFGLLLFSLFIPSDAKKADSPVTSEAGSEKAASEVVHINKADFLKKVHNYEASPKEWKFLGDKPAIVDFYADWCGPCRRLAPVLDELSKEYAGKIVIYKVDTDAEQELAAAFAIRSIPSMLFIPSKGEPQMVRGALPKAELVKLIDGFLLSDK